ncbi:hypothetical protein Tco_0436405 [Tanacetum coccineum]
MSWFLRCSWCGGPFNGGNCWCCTNVSFKDEFVRNPDPISYDETPDFSYPPPQPHTYSCELCGNDSYYGYDCPPRVPLVYEQEPCYNQNLGDNYYPQNSPSFLQQYLCCESYGGPHTNFQCQPRNHNFHEPNLCYNSNSSGFDQLQQYSIDHQPQSIQEDLNQQRMNDECIKSHNDMIESRNELFKTMQSLFGMLREQAANLSTHTPEPSRRFNSICYDDEESTILLNAIISQIPPSIAITPVLPTMEPEDSLIMGNEDLRTIPEKESDEFIKSSVEDLVLIPRESEDTSDSDKECDLPFCDNSVTFSNPLFDANDDFTSSDDESLPEEDVLEENFKIYSNPLFDFDDKYISININPLFNEVLEDIESKDSYVSNFDELALLVTPLFDANEDECFDPGGNIDKIDAFLDIDVSTDIEDGYHDSEGDIIYLEGLLINDTILNLPPEVFLDHDPSSLKDEPDNDDLKSMVKIFDPRIHEKIISPT